jgi:hypothetical protein
MLGVPQRHSRLDVLEKIPVYAETKTSATLISAAKPSQAKPHHTNTLTHRNVVSFVSCNSQILLSKQKPIHS